MAVLGMTQSKVSRHLATLRHAGLVRDRKEGTWSYYAMNAVKNEFEQTHLNALRSALASHPDAAQTLQDLDDLKKREGRTGSCAADIVHRPSLPKKLSNRGPASSKGIQR
jgi:DNA-binding transcriptional ArsR family regulator